MDEDDASAESATSTQTGADDGMELRERAVRVLVVDDEPSIVRIVRHNCERVGLFVLSATSGLEALRMLEQSEVDLIIADWFMPEMSGFALLERVRQDAGNTNLPFLLLHNRPPQAGDNDSRSFFDWDTNMPNVWMLGKPLDPLFLLRVIAMMLPPYETSLKIVEGRPRWSKRKA